MVHIMLESGAGMNTLPSKIVVVDDDDATVEFLCEFFGMQGMVVAPCSEGHDTFAYIVQQQPTLVILDLFLTCSRGTDILLQLRANETMRDVPVIFFTGSGDMLHQLLPDYAEHGAYLVVKPGIDQLADLVHHITHTG
jgi:DNA-binding response OmpR family regulator